MNLIENIDETRERWRSELEKVREAFSYPNSPTRLERALVELDYLLVEARNLLDDECTCDPATAVGIDIPGAGSGIVCPACRRRLNREEIPY